jgi:uncharacterized protein (TIGR02996 family)
MDERAAFEKGIDNNPLEATNHLVYADWLDEHGEHDEAAFRRSMGEWVREGHGKPNRVIPRRSEFLNKMAYWVPHHNMPSGVDVNDIETWQRRNDDIQEFANKTVLRTDGSGYFPKDPAHATFEWYHYPTVAQFGWEKYRHMEEGLRRAFMIGRKRQQSGKLSRAATAVRRLRRRS